VHLTNRAVLALIPFITLPCLSAGSSAAQIQCAAGCHCPVTSMVTYSNTPFGCVGSIAYSVTNVRYGCCGLINPNCPANIGCTFDISFSATCSVTIPPTPCTLDVKRNGGVLSLCSGGTDCFALDCLSTGHPGCGFSWYYDVFSGTTIVTTVTVTCNGCT